MKKISIFIFAATIVASFFTSCKKDDFNGMQFKASMERIADKDGKTYFAYNSDGGGTFYWKSSDDFKVWDDEHIGRNYKIQLPAGASYTTFANDPDAGLYAETVELVTTNDAPALSEGTFYAFYPGYKSGWDGVAGKHTVVLDRDQVLDNWDPDKYNASTHGTEDAYAAARLPMIHLKRFPMYAKTTNNTLRFKHLCGALMLKLQQSGKSIRAIKFTTTDQQVSGTFTVNTSVNPTSNPLEVKTTGLTADEMTTNITFSKPVSIANSTMFWIRLPQGVYRNFSITIVDAEYNEVRLSPTTGGYIEIKRGCVTPVDFTGGSMDYSAPEGLGVFTVAVDANGNPTKKVYFSPGNLQFVDEHWKFADHQYDLIHPRSWNQYDPEETHQWDLFGWSTTHSQFGKAHTSTVEYHAGNGVINDYVEWGSVFGDNTWTTLTQAEYRCLLTERNSSNIKINNQSVGLYTAVIVNNVPGIMLYPDDLNLTLPNNIPVPSTRAAYSVEEFSVFEDAGCIFMPATGYVQSLSLPGLINEFNPDNSYFLGAYWTSDNGTSVSATSAHPIKFTGTDLDFTQSLDRPEKLAVRLVRQAPLSK